MLTLLELHKNDLVTMNNRIAVLCHVNSDSPQLLILAKLLYEEPAPGFHRRFRDDPELEALQLSKLGLFRSCDNLYSSRTEIRIVSYQTRLWLLGLIGFVSRTIPEHADQLSMERYWSDNYYTDPKIKGILTTSPSPTGCLDSKNIQNLQ